MPQQSRKCVCVHVYVRCCDWCPLRCMTHHCPPLSSAPPRYRTPSCFPPTNLLDTQQQSLTVFQYRARTRARTHSNIHERIHVHIVKAVAATGHGPAKDQMYWVCVWFPFWIHFFSNVCVSSLPTGCSSFTSAHYCFQVFFCFFTPFVGKIQLSFQNLSTFDYPNAKKQWHKL